MRYKSLDLMIKMGKTLMYGNPWMEKNMAYEQSDGIAISVRAAWDELAEIHGFLRYRNELFFLEHRSERAGRGGMDEGSPESIVVHRSPKRGVTDDRPAQDDKP